MNIEKLLTFTHNNKPSEKDLEDISGFLLESLSDYLGQEIACFQEHIVVGEALVLSVRNKSPMPGPFALQWDGVLLYDVTEAGPSIDAELFLFSHGERVATLQSQGDAFIVLSFDIEDGHGEWKFSSWMPDGHGEWKYISKPRTELYDKFERTYG